MRKIDYAVAAADVFATHLHRENFDRGMIATFGNTFREELRFTGTEQYIHYVLKVISESNLSEQTRLYDSIEDTIERFWATGHRDRPWLLTVITDGQDNLSRRYPPQRASSPIDIGQYIGRRFNHEPSNFIFVIGVGEGSQINKPALGAMGDAGGFLAMTVAAFPLLEAVFLRIAIQVSTAVVGRSVNVGNFSWSQVAEIQRTSSIPFDYAFLIDRSGSMNEPG